MESEFLDALAKSGISPSHPLILDGNLRRFQVAGDKKGRRNGWYRFVRLRDDFAYGVFGCNKRQISGKWSNKKKNEYTAYDTKAIKKRQAEIKKQEEELQERIAVKANLIWSRIKPAANNAYASRKGIGLYNVKEMNEALVVPVYGAEAAIVSLQYIFPDGGKRFLYGGRTQGCYGLITGADDAVYICEGYATGASLFEATGKTVALAFYAANLVPVAQEIRRLCPDKAIVIAGDNDQWTEKPRNPGLSYGREAADKIGAKLIFPEFSHDDPKKPTDWNDFHLRYGMAALRVAIEGVKERAMEIAPAKQWQSTLMPGKEVLPGYNDFDPKSRRNVYLFLKNHPLFKDKIVYNRFADREMIIACPPWEKDEGFIPHKINDPDYFGAMMVFEEFKMKINQEIIEGAVSFIAHENEVNPPRDYFEKLAWDGVDRLNSWLRVYLGAGNGSGQSSDYLETVGSKWLMGAVARCFNPGTKFDNVLVLEGGQGIKKTAAFEALATFNNENYFLEFSGDVTNKDSLALMQGKIIVEMAELASLRRSQIEEMKAFISRRIDEYRPVYGRTSVMRPRFFILGGSTNKVGKEYLEDETGARRIWPVQCGETIDLEGLKRDREQLWAEAVARYKSGERIWLEGVEVEMAKMEQADRQSEDAWEDKISGYLVGQYEVTASAVMNNIGLPVKEQNNFTLGRIKSCMMKLGWKEFKSHKKGEGRNRKWRKS